VSAIRRVLAESGSVQQVAASGGNRQRNRITTHRSLYYKRAILRRLPKPAKRWVLAGRRWQRQAAAQMNSRWHRSLQLRVVVTTLALSALVIAVLGFYLVQLIAAGLLNSAESADSNVVLNGRTNAEGQSSVNVLAPTAKQGSVNGVALTTAKTLQAAQGNSGNYLVFIRLANPGPGESTWVGDLLVNLSATIPQSLYNSVSDEQRIDLYNNEITASALYAPTTLTYGSGLGTDVPALAVGIPLGTYYQLYYVFPFSQGQYDLLLVQRILVGVGLALVLLLAAIASLVTRWVVLPVRRAAQAARRLTAGHLGERMPMRGKDDLAALGTAFNEMAASLQDKLRELEDLSQVQRQFVSDVSHELRTPLTTIKMAVDLLFESREDLDPVGSRSVELLQSQLERYETLVIDLLEISRFDAGAATLEAEFVDVCDLVRRSADDAQQLAERRGSRIEFRLPAAGCFAEVDRRRVERILRNILVNAVEHGEGKDVVITTALDSDAVAVSVRDYGVGLRPGEEHRVFERFWRADPARARNTGGTGLGLAISLEDARLHGGWLQAWGERGKGSVFRLTLPRVAGQKFAGSPLPLEPDDAEIVTSLAGTNPFPVPEITEVVTRG
jgi:two-component system, OmpR family, sensor histidine kinase MtrB